MVFFRFYNLNPVYRGCLSKFHCYGQKNAYLCSRNRMVEAFASSQPYEHHPLIQSSDHYYKIPKRWHIGHSHHDQRHDRSGKEGENIFRLGLAADVGLAAGKALTGYLSGSTAIIADAAHSISDVVLSGVALLSFKAARVPKDKEHPYGHF